MSISVLENKSNQNLIEALKELLKQAELGHLQSLVYCGLRSDGYVSQGWSLAENTRTNTLIGEISLLQRDFIDACADLRINPESGELTR